MNNLEAIEAQIVAVLRTVPDFVKIYDYEPVELFELPAATLFYSGFDSDDSACPEALETAEQWVLRLYLPLQDAETAQTDMKKLIPKVREAFRINRSLSNRCLYTRLPKGRIMAVMDKTVPQLMAELQLTAITEESS